MAKVRKNSFDEIIDGSDGPFSASAWDRFREVDEGIGFSEMIREILDAPEPDKDKVLRDVKSEMDVRYKKFLTGGTD